MKFGNLLIYLREKRFGLSINKMAKRAGVYPLSLRIWETGAKTPSVENIFRLEKVYEIPHGGLLSALLGTDKRKIYVSHPLRNDKIGEALTATADRNRKEVSEICRKILTEEKDVLILSPINAFGFLSTTPEEDALALDQCKALLELADELWVYGDWQNSKGCRAEIAYAEILKLPIKYKNRQTQD